MGAEFDGKKIVVVGGSAGMGRQVALDVIDRGGSAVIIGRSKDRVDDTVAELTDRRGQAWGIAAELTDRRCGRRCPARTFRASRRRDTAGQRGRILHPQAVSRVRRHSSTTRTWS